MPISVWSRDVAIGRPAGGGGLKAPIRTLLAAEGGDVPRAGRIDRGPAEGEEVLAVGIGLRLEAVAQIGRPLGERREGVDLVRVGELAGAVDQRLAAFLALPVVRADVLEAHGGGFPLVVGAHGERNVGAVGLDLVETAKNSSSVFGTVRPSSSKMSLL